MKLRIRKNLLVVSTVLLLGGGNLLARSVTQYDLEAAYLVRFLEFVDWPARAFKDGKAPFVIGILGDDPFGDMLEHLVQGRLFKGRAVEVRRFGSYDEHDAVALRDCHILFVSGSEKDRLSEVLRRLQGAPVLTVSEIDKFPLFGGILGFDQEGRKIKLRLNPKAAKTAQLNVSARLAQVCRIYHED